MRKLLTLLLPLLFYVTSVAAPAPITDTVNIMQPAHRVRFEFHSAFLMNLHHFLYDAAVHDGKLEKEAWQTAPTDAQMQTLRDAVTFYKRHYAKQSLLFDESMRDIKVALSVDDDRRDATGLKLPGDLMTVLNGVAPIYAQCIWAAQNQANLAWIQQVRKLDAAYGAEIQAHIEHDLAHAFPSTPIRDDIVVASGDWAGAYTTEEPPQSVLPSGNEDYQGLASLEMLYHEASHIYVTDTVSDEIDADLKAMQRSDHGLWHAVQFYTVGEVVKNVLKRRADLDYQPYAQKNRVYTRGWSAYVPLLEGPWQSYLQGSVSMQ
ncbi:MAG TPA: hypothetical protein VNW52_11295, partial [Burkholderiaceae bacterium]|nr:hypothetical protein [Burkholderiaceae bacterium]